jgi:hypothetical protein
MFPAADPEDLGLGVPVLDGRSQLPARMEVSGAESGNPSPAGRFRAGW